jgi:hypothetical protein
MTQTMTHHYPPIGFPLYGLDASWLGTRWLKFVQGPVGEPLYEVTLGHGDRPVPMRGHPLLDITTRSAKNAHDRDSVAFQRELAFSGLFTLMNMTAPTPDAVLDRERMWKKALAYAGRRADQYLRWASVTWSVDGVPTAARFTRFAGAWTGFSLAVDGIGFWIVGYRVGPEDLGIAQIASGEPYGFDLAEPVVYPDTLHSAQAALGQDHWSDPPPRPLHADWRPFVTGDD